MNRRQGHPLATVIAASVLFSAAPAYAIDGEVLISQAKANAGNVTPGDTPGFPVTISRRGKYKLSSNLAVPAGQAGIAVEQSDVTIDLNGFTIMSRPLRQAGRAIYGNKNNLEVRNGTVTGFTDFAISSSAFAVIENMRIVGGGSFGLALGDDARVINSTIADNRSGIYCGFRCLIEGNLITGSTAGSGVTLSLPGGTVLGNVIASNKGVGISTNGASGYSNNILVGNNDGGAQTSGGLFSLHPNICLPVCP